jgi:hypothetical protein
MAVLNHRPGFSTATAAALVLALFVGGLPPLSGVTITGAEGAPAFTLDICHPLPGINHGVAFSAFPLGHILCSIDRPLPSGAAPELRAPLVIRASEAPDPPPPKSLRQYPLQK